MLLQSCFLVGFTDLFFFLCADSPCRVLCPKDEREEEEEEKDERRCHSLARARSQLALAGRLNAAAP